MEREKWLYIHNLYRSLKKRIKLKEAEKGCRVGSSCEVKQVGSWRRQEEAPDSDAFLTLVEGCREEGHLDRKSLGLQQSSRKCSVRSIRSP